MSLFEMFVNVLHIIPTGSLRRQNCQQITHQIYWKNLKYSNFGQKQYDIEQRKYEIFRL